MLSPRPTARRPAGAFPLARRAVELGPATATDHDTPGIVLCRLGRWREAVTELEASRAGQPRTYGAFDLYVLALCHHRPGDTSRAGDPRTPIRPQSPPSAK